MRTGSERPGSPVLIRAVVGNSSWFGLVNNQVRFHALQEFSRAALLLSKGAVYIAFGSSCDVRPYFGWVLAYDARRLKQTGVFNTAPEAGESGIWQSDAGIAADAEGNVYAVTGNGKFTAATGGRDFGDSLLKLGWQSGALTVRDYFTPSNETRLNRDDQNLGSCGPILLPDLPGPHSHLVTAGGKDGVLFLIDRDDMGKYQPASNAHSLQSLKVAKGGCFGAPAYWNGHLDYFGAGDVLQDFALASGRLAETPAHSGPIRFNAGAVPSVSANGTKDGIVWTILTKGFREPDVEAELQAYDAPDVSRLLYTSGKNHRDGPGMVIRFSIPMVAGGRVYLGARDQVSVYGLH